MFPVLTGLSTSMRTCLLGILMVILDPRNLEPRFPWVIIYTDLRCSQQCFAHLRLMEEGNGKRDPKWPEDLGTQPKPLSRGSGSDNNQARRATVPFKEARKAQNLLTTFTPCSHTREGSGPVPSIIFHLQASEGLVPSTYQQGGTIQECLQRVHLEDVNMELGAWPAETLCSGRPKKEGPISSALPNPCTYHSGFPHPTMPPSQPGAESPLPAGSLSLSPPTEIQTIGYPGQKGGQDH